MTEPTPVEQISFLARSETRVRILEALLHTDAATQSELRDGLEASRSTVTRSLTALEDRGWIRQTNRAYRLTPIGEVVAEGFLDLRESIEVAGDLSTFLEWFPYAEYPVDIGQLSDAEITPTSESDPYAPARQQSELLQEVDRFRGLLPSIDLEGTRLVHERVVNGQLEGEVILSAGVAETVESGEFATLFREKIETGRLDVYAVDGELPFYLGITGEKTVQIGVEDDEGFPRALLETSAESVSEWAETVYRTHRERATVKTASDF